MRVEYTEWLNPQKIKMGIDSEFLVDFMLTTIYSVTYQSTGAALTLVL